MLTLAHYAKSLMYIALTAVLFLVTALTDGRITLPELLNLIVVVLGAIVVYLIPNFPTKVGKYMKTIDAFLVAGIVALLSFLTGGVTLSEWMQIILAAFAAVGVYITPNTPADPGVKP